MREASALQPKRDFSGGRRPRPRPRRSLFRKNNFLNLAWSRGTNLTRREKRKERKGKRTLRLFATFNWERIGFFFPQS